MSSIPSEYYKYGLVAGLGLAALAEYDTIDLVYNTLGRDLKALIKFGRILSEFRSIQRNNKTMPDFFAQTVKKYSTKPMIISAETGETWSFMDMDLYSNRIANFFTSRGFKRGDVIGIYMDNKAKYIAYVIGLAKIGVTSALINNNLTFEPLQHCINSAMCKGLIYDYDKENNVVEVAGNLQTSSPDVAIQMFCIDVPQATLPALKAEVLDVVVLRSPSSAVPDSIRRTMKWNDELMYIYTSGTTGLPKPARGDHARYSLAAFLSIKLAGVEEKDRLYTTMPMYHSSGQWFGLGASIYGGTTIILRKSFSAKHFWSDCVKYDATVAQYIGEICRFLLATPKCPEEKLHKLRMMYGIGLRPKIWKEFTDRFKIPHIVEMYGSTEGTIGAINMLDKVGAIGYISRLFPILPLKIIKVDANGNAIRDPKTGLCIECKPNEPGEIIGGIRPDDRGGPEKFSAYVNNPTDNQKKLLKNVIKKGDTFFRSGDIVVMDKYGWLYFQDRTGDTFRWRGENVSTSEVESVIAKLIDHRDTVVYGVEIPGVEGKAGMVAIVDPDKSVDLDKLASGIHRNLPRYARPLFLRRLDQAANVTGTYKLIKGNLQKEGYNLDLLGPTADIYFMGPNDKTYKKLDRNVYNEILNNLTTAKL